MQGDELHMSFSHICAFTVCSHLSPSPLPPFIFHIAILLSFFLNPQSSFFFSFSSSLPGPSPSLFLSLPFFLCSHTTNSTTLSFSPLSPFWKISFFPLLVFPLSLWAQVRAHSWNTFLHSHLLNQVTWHHASQNIPRHTTFWNWNQIDLTILCLEK